MHAVARRMPAERARHVKRLGYVNPLVLPVSTDVTNTTTTTTAQQETTSAASATSQATTTSVLTSQLPTSTPTSSTTPPSSVSSSTATSSDAVSSVVSSDSTQPPAATSTVPSSSPISYTQSTTVTLSIRPTDASPTPTPRTDISTNRGLSGGAIAGIVAGSVVVGIALIVFLVRKTYLRRRERKHISWNGLPGLGSGTPDEPKFPDMSEELPSLTSASDTPFEHHGQFAYAAPARVQAPPVTSYFTPAPPPATYNNPTPVAAYSVQPAHNPAFTMEGMPRAQHAPLEAIVKFTFVPTLPDELSITNGEPVFLLEEYDDGWALCANGRGERGMVPRECLERGPTPDQPGVAWRNMRRMSSLNPDGSRF